jgi:hypothetical protein
MLRKIVFLVVAMALLAPVAIADEWVGYITDEHCGIKGAKKDHGDCAKSCAGRGAALLLYDVAGKKLYKLDDQTAAKAMAGQKVKVTGELAEETIKVKSIVEEAEE